MTNNETCCHKTKKRSQEEHKRLVNRLSRVEGQIRGIKKMVEEDAYCIDILIQVAAANAALNSFNKELLAEHIRTCVADDIKNGREETIEELKNMVRIITNEWGGAYILITSDHGFLYTYSSLTEDDKVD